MKNYTKQYLKAVTREYPYMNDYIARRREAILSPNDTETDENIGGGRSSTVGRPVEALALKIAEDEQIGVCEKHKQAIETTLLKMEPVMQEVIKKRYFYQLSQDSVSEELAVTIAFIRVTEAEYFRDLARRLKLMI